MVNYTVFQYKVHNAKLKIPRYNLWELSLYWEKNPSVNIVRSFKSGQCLKRGLCYNNEELSWKVVSNNKSFTVSLKKISGKKL